MQKGFLILWVAVGVGLIVLGAGTVYYGVKVFSNKPQAPKVEQKACTLEAKLCPDGSSVGRVGPNCEFAECPMTAPLPVSSDSAQLCIQVITPARNVETGECHEYPTPCDLPIGWEKVESC